MSPVIRATDRLALPAFDKFQVQLIREMEDYGWTGVIGKKGHAIMQAPDGVTTCSVVPKEGSPRSRANQQKVFKAWLRQMEEMSAEAIELAEARDISDALAKMRFASRFHPPTTPALELIDAVLRPQIELRDPRTPPVPAPAPVDTAPEPEPEPVRRSVGWCGLCEIDFRTRQAVAVHRNHKHVRELCEICDGLFSPAQLTRHIRVDHDLSDARGLARQLHLAQVELAQMRQEVSEWQTLAEETEDRYAALRDRHNRLVMAANALHELLQD